jgi:hypothetical protein
VINKNWIAMIIKITTKGNGKTIVANGNNYRNLSLGFTIKARACKGAGQEGSPKVTFHATGSARECEGMNLHPPKWVLTLGVGVPMDSQIFKERFERSKPNGLRSSLYH